MLAWVCEGGGGGGWCRGKYENSVFSSNHNFWKTLPSWRRSPPSKSPLLLSGPHGHYFVPLNYLPFPPFHLFLGSPPVFAFPHLSHSFTVQHEYRQLYQYDTVRYRLASHRSSSSSHSRSLTLRPPGPYHTLCRSIPDPTVLQHSSTGALLCPELLPCSLPLPPSSSSSHPSLFTFLVLQPRPSSIPSTHPFLSPSRPTACHCCHHHNNQ
ncbi:hypothetical protein HOY80DRAFT_503436 [Tuber brumale]|nr:hypothetical protein HOY80DRAFT_503436 [Tuber brumale]